MDISQNEESINQKLAATACKGINVAKEIMTDLSRLVLN